MKLRILPRNDGVFQPHRWKNFQITDQQMEAFIIDFYLGLPDYMQVALDKAA